MPDMTKKEFEEYTAHLTKVAEAHMTEIVSQKLLISLDNFRNKVSLTEDQSRYFCSVYEIVASYLSKSEKIFEEYRAYKKTLDEKK